MSHFNENIINTTWLSIYKPWYLPYTYYNMYLNGKYIYQLIITTNHPIEAWNVILLLSNKINNLIQFKSINKILDCDISMLSSNNKYIYFFFKKKELVLFF